MFICKKELANEYFNWLFTILNEFKKQNDFSGYEEGNMRVLGYLSERLLNVFVKKHDLKIKEYILLTEARIPQLSIFESRFIFFQKVFKTLLDFEKKIKNKYYLSKFSGFCKSKMFNSFFNGIIQFLQKSN